MLFDLGAEFIDLEEKNKYGETPLLRCSSSGVRVDPDCIKFLLDRGASVKAKDYRGCTCLHLLFSPSFIHWQIDPGVRDSLILLVKAGANVHARTNAGESVFDVAYESGCGNADAASRIRLWAEVLTACGYDGARLHEDWRSRRFPDQSDVVKESSVEGNASSNMQDIEKEFGVDEQNLQDIGKELCVDEQDLQDNEPGFDQDLYTDEGSPRVYAQGFGRNSHVDERYLQGEELDYDVFTNDSNITSLSYESRTNATETGFALHGVEESIYANAWSDEIVDGQSMSVNLLDPFFTTKIWC
jgi:ankyrin repeat protein